MTVPGQGATTRVQRWAEHGFAYALPLAPVVAALLSVVLLVQHRGRIGLWRSERTTGVVFATLGILGLTSASLAPSPPKAVEGLAGMALVFLLWLTGRFAIQDAPRFLHDLSRAIGILAVLAALATFVDASVHVNVGPYDFAILDPVSVGTVLGLGSGGLGPLLVYGGILALGRARTEPTLAGRLEGLGIAVAAVAMSLALGVRHALWGSVIGAAALAPAVGSFGLLVVLAVSGATLAVVPGVWPGFTGLLQAGSQNVRVSNWLTAFRMICDYPLLGIGPNNYLLLTPKYAPPGIDQSLGPHSIYLRVASEWGIPAAALFFGWVAIQVRRGWRLRVPLWRWGLIGGLVAFLAMGIFDDPLFTFHASGAVFIGMGLSVSRGEA